MKFKWMLCVAAVLSTVCSVWADDDEKGEDTRPYVSIDKREIINKTDNKADNFRTLIDRLNHELVETGLYRVMNTEDMVRALTKKDEFSVAADDGGGKTKITTPAFFVCMTITTYGLTTMGGQNLLTSGKTRTPG